MIPINRNIHAPQESFEVDRCRGCFGKFACVPEHYSPGSHQRTSRFWRVFLHSISPSEIRVADPLQYRKIYSDQLLIQAYRQTHETFHALLNQ